MKTKLANNYFHYEVQMVNTKIRLIIFLQPKMEELYTVRKNKTRSSLWLRSWTPFTKFRLKLKKVGKTTRPFRYDLNQINYTVKLTNRFKDSDLIDRVPEELWTEVPDICIGGSDQDHPQEKEMKKAKWLPEEALQIAEKRREVKGKGEKKDIPIWMQSSKE